MGISALLPNSSIWIVRAEDPLGWEAEFRDMDLELRFDDDYLWLISWRVIIAENDVVHWPD